MEITEVNNLIYFNNPQMPLSTNYEDSDIQVNARIYNSSNPGDYVDSTFSIKIDVPEVHPFQIQFGNIIDDNSFEISVNNPNYSTITWSPSELFDCNTCHFTNLSIDESQFIFIEGMNENNCRVRDSLWLNIKTISQEVFVPNVFSPNQDGINDVVNPSIPSEFKALDFKIFDRWGQNVFEGKGDFGWDGNRGGKNCESGIYVYIFRYLNEKGKTKISKGSISLIRQ